jgi:hypothetical protein
VGNSTLIFCIVVCSEDSIPAGRWKDDDDADNDNMQSFKPGNSGKFAALAIDASMR